MTHSDLKRVWIQSAHCADPQKLKLANVELEDFFREGVNANTEARVQQLCETCPSKTPCLEDALAHQHNSGVWGGLSAVQRTSIQKRK